MLFPLAINLSNCFPFLSCIILSTLSISFLLAYHPIHIFMFDRLKFLSFKRNRFLFMSHHSQIMTWIRQILCISAKYPHRQQWILSFDPHWIILLSVRLGHIVNEGKLIDLKLARLKENRYLVLQNSSPLHYIAGEKHTLNIYLSMLYP